MITRQQLSRLHQRGHCFLNAAGAICLLLLSVNGCNNAPAPPPIATEQREAIKNNLTKKGARVSSDTPEALYLSLRNTHVQVQDSGATVEPALRTQSDVQDFFVANEVIASSVLTPTESEEFKKWLRTSVASKSSPVHKVAYDQFRVTFSRKPLRLIYTRTTPAEP